MPAWASRLQAEQTGRHRRQMAIHAIREGDRGGASATPDIKERD
jgi:type IV secretion system protein TrbL